MINPELIHFLLDLAENNNREWFAQNKDRYKRLSDEFEHFVDALILKIGEFDPAVKGLTAKDSVYRIYRDVRFSANKEPYKNHIGCFISPGGKNSELAGYYFHLEPGASMLAGGLYCPQSSTLKTVRESIDQHHEELRGILQADSFASRFGALQGEQLKTAPKGYPKEHPALDLLRFKSYTFMAKLDDELLQQPHLLDYIAESFRAAYPLNTYLNAALRG